MTFFARSALAAGIALAAPYAVAAPALTFDIEWTNETGVFDESAAEIVVHDATTQRVFVVNGFAQRIDVLDANDGSLIGNLDVSAVGSPNSVAVKNGTVAVAVAAPVETDPGSVVFFDANDATIGAGGTSTGSAAVGALPDMVTFTPDGTRVLVANEGEPAAYGDQGNDPVGSVSVVDISGGVGSPSVSTADFGSFTKAGLLAQNDGVRITGPGTGGDAEATAAQDLEPEYITVSADGSKAYVTLQENNAIAVVDVATATVEEVRGLGSKDHGAAGNGIDASDNDGVINIQQWSNVYGMPMPDSIGSYEANGSTYLVTANEGDAREYDVINDDVSGGTVTTEYTDETRIEDIGESNLGSAFTGLVDDANLGRLQVSAVADDGSVPATYEDVMSFGTRSFSIWDAETGALVWDSGDAFEQITADLYPDYFNSTNNNNSSFDSRSDAKGPEPEALVLGAIDDNMLAFIGLERIGGIMVYDITDPTSPEFITYLLDRDFTVAADTSEAGDLGPEGLYFLTPDESPFGTYGLLVANEVSGTTTFYSIAVPVPAPLALFAAGLLPLLRLHRR